MKMFNKINMRSEDLHAMLKDGYFGTATRDAQGVITDFTEAAVEDGAFVSICDPMTHELYGGDIATTQFGLELKDLNARMITGYCDKEPVYGFVDYVGVNTADVMHVQYRVGDKVAGIGVPAGEHTRVRMVELGDEFYLGDENFASAPTVGQFAVVPAADQTTLTPAAAKPASGFAIKIDDTKPLIMGQVNNGKLYRCRVVQL